MLGLRDCFPSKRQCQAQRLADSQWSVLSPPTRNTSQSSNNLRTGAQIQFRPGTTFQCSRILMVCSQHSDGSEHRVGRRIMKGSASRCPWASFWAPLDPKPDGAQRCSCAAAADRGAASLVSSTEHASQSRDITRARIRASLAQETASVNSKNHCPLPTWWGYASPEPICLLFWSNMIQSWLSNSDSYNNSQSSGQLGVTSPLLGCKKKKKKKEWLLEMVYTISIRSVILLSMKLTLKVLNTFYWGNQS